MGEMFSEAIWGVSGTGQLFCRVCDRMARFVDPVAHEKRHFRFTSFKCSISSCFISTVFDEAVKHVEESGGSHPLVFSCLACNYRERDLGAYISHLHEDFRKGSSTTRTNYSEGKIDGSGLLLPKCPQTVTEICPAERYGVSSFVLTKEGLTSSHANCQVCSRRIRTISHLERHFLLSSYVCRYCKLDWQQYDIELQKQDTSERSGHDFTYFCHPCQVYSTFEEHLSHLRVHEMVAERSAVLKIATLNRIAMDPLCQSSFRRKMTPGDERPFNTSSFKSGFDKLKLNTSCVVCQEEHVKWELIFHVTKHYCDIRLFCLVCFDVFGSDIGQALLHEETHQTDTSTFNFIGYVCLYCGVVTNSVVRNTICDHLIEHWQNKSQYEPLFECRAMTWTLSCYPRCLVHFEAGSEACEATFSDVNALFSHVREHAGKTYTVPAFDEFSLMQTLLSEAHEQNSTDKAAPESNEPLPKKIKPSTGNNNLNRDFTQNITAETSMSTSGHLGTVIVQTNTAPSPDVHGAVESVREQDEPARNGPLIASAKIKEEDNCSVVKHSIKPRIKIFTCKVCNKRFVAEHFFRTHLEKMGH